MIALTRSYRFPAAHVLRRPDLSEQENRRLYGKCANPNGHGHDYGLEVTVRGELDRRNGWLVDPEQLDAIVRERVLAPLGHRLLNTHPWFADLVPTGENVARTIHRELARALVEETSVELVRVRVLETRRNEFESGEA